MSDKILIEHDDSFTPESGFIGDSFSWTNPKLEYVKTDHGVKMTYFRNSVQLFSKNVTRNVEIISFTLLPNVFSMNEFEQKINTTKKHLIAYIGYSGCPPCVKIMENIHRLTKTFPEIEFVKIDAEMFPNFISESDKVPLFRIYDRGNTKYVNQYQNSNIDLVKEKISLWTKNYSFDEDF